MDASKEVQTEKKKFVTGAMITIVAASFILFLGVIVYFWLTQAESPAILDIEVSAEYDRAEIAIKSSSQTVDPRTIDTSKQTSYRYFLKSGVINIRILRDERVIFEEIVDVQPDQHRTLRLKGNPGGG